MNELSNKIKFFSIINIILMPIACFIALQFWAISCFWSDYENQAGAIMLIKLVFLALLFAMSFFASVMALIRKNLSTIDTLIIFFAWVSLFLFRAIL